MLEECDRVNPNAGVVHLHCLRNWVLDCWKALESLLHLQQRSDHAKTGDVSDSMSEWGRPTLNDTPSTAWAGQMYRLPIV